MQISGEIVVAAESASFEAATAFVYIEDTGRADAVAQRLGRVSLADAAHRQGAESRIPFAVETTEPPDTGTVGVRVHISLNGVEDVTSRDLVSAAYIQATEGESVEVAVSPV